MKVVVVFEVERVHFFNEFVVDADALRLGESLKEAHQRASFVNLGSILASYILLDYLSIFLTVCVRVCVCGQSKQTDLTHVTCVVVNEQTLILLSWWIFKTFRALHTLR